MKRSLLILIIVMVSICLAGCGERVKGRMTRDLQLQVRYPVLAGMKDKAVQEKINTLLYSIAFKLKDEHYSEVENCGKGYEYIVHYEVSRYNKALLSIRYMECLSMPLYAHPFNSMRAVTINLKDGSVYRLADLFKPESNYRTVLNKILKEKMRVYAEGSEDKLLAEFRGADKDQEFYLTKDAIGIFWQEAVYLPRYLGPLTIMVEYKRIADILRNDLLP